MPIALTGAKKRTFIVGAGRMGVGEAVSAQVLRQWIGASKIGRLGQMAQMVAEQPTLLNAKDPGTAVFEC